MLPCAARTRVPDARWRYDRSFAFAAELTRRFGIATEYGLTGRQVLISEATRQAACARRSHQTEQQRMTRLPGRRSCDPTGPLPATTSCARGEQTQFRVHDRWRPADGCSRDGTTRAEVAGRHYPRHSTTDAGSARPASLLADLPGYHRVNLRSGDPQASAAVVDAGLVGAAGQAGISPAVQLYSVRSRQSDKIGDFT